MRLQRAPPAPPKEKVAPRRFSPLLRVLPRKLLPAATQHGSEGLLLSGGGQTGGQPASPPFQVQYLGHLHPLLHPRVHLWGCTSVALPGCTWHLALVVYHLYGIGRTSLGYSRRHTGTHAPSACYLNRIVPVAKRLSYEAGLHSVAFCLCSEFTHSPILRTLSPVVRAYHWLQGV